MQFPESWLREFCNPDLSTDALAQLLTMSGMEVEALSPVAPPFSGIVVGEILEAAPHPNADRLRVCKVAAGMHSEHGPLQIVCGAPNARVGIRVPLALVGAKLPPGADGKPFEIGLGKLRGVESQGMLCSAKELHVDDDAGGLLELPGDAPVGASVRDYLRLDDTLFTLKLTPNLGHCLSVYGIAREVAALTGAPLKTLPVTPVPARNDAHLPVHVEAPDLCGRFSGRVIRGIDPTAKTPDWMVQRLARCGQRSVSALVDISNYVMFESGQPSHIFDLDKIHGSLVVRWAKAGETLQLLNGNQVTLDGDVGVIADDHAVESLAGIMGGNATAVSDDTRNVYVEAAFWWPEAVAGRSRRYNFSTDAGHRFERGVDPDKSVEHIERITALVLEICGGDPGPMDDQTLRLPERAPVALRVARAAQVIGMPVSETQCLQSLTRLGLDVRQESGRLWVTPPSWRFDVAIEEDLIEEVIRVIGFDNLPLTPPVAPVVSRPAREDRRSPHAVRHALAALDYQEAITFSFVEERWEREWAGNDNPIRLLNPIAAPLAVMRSGLVGSLVQVLKHNLARRQNRVRMFEIGRVFRRDAAVPDGPFTVAGIDQPQKLAGLAYGALNEMQWGAAERLVDFFDVKGDIESLMAPLQPRFQAAEHPAMHPGRCASVWLGEQLIGHVGECHPRWRQAYELPHAPVFFELDLVAAMRRPIPAYVQVPRQQAVTRDLSVVVGEHVCHDAVMAAIARAASGGLVRHAKLFDVYRPHDAQPDMQPGERSLALRLELLDDAAALTDARSDEVVAAVLAQLHAELGARLRGQLTA